MVLIEKKTLAVVVAIVLLSTSVVVASELVHFENDREIDIISRVNEEGSMLFIRPNLTAEDYCTVSNGTMTISQTQHDNWGGLVIGTPGITTIQHKMLEQFVTFPYQEEYVPNETGLDMNFEPYRSGTVLNKDTVYYDPSLTNKAQWDSPMTSYMKAGIIWEPVCSAVVLSGAGTELIDTSVLSPGHACCVIAGTHQYLSTHENTVIQFLRGYVKSVNEIHKIIENKGTDPESYQKFVKYVAQSTQNTEETVIRAIEQVKYTYGNDGDYDSNDFPLTNLRYEIAQFLRLAGLKDKLNAMGYTGDNAELDYANTIINDKYLMKALDDGYEFVERDAQINVAAIKGDIHQIALQFGIEMGYYSEHKITINIFQAPNGAGVATSLQNGAANIGFMGVPPITLITVNSALNPVKTLELSGKIVDGSGAPVANADVKIISGEHIYTCKTDDNGNFKLTVLRGFYAFSENTGNIITVDTGGGPQGVDIKMIQRLESNYDLGQLSLVIP